jgi:hypothetical protein
VYISAVIFKPGGAGVSIFLIAASIFGPVVAPRRFQVINLRRNLCLARDGHSSVERLEETVALAPDVRM